MLAAVVAGPSLASRQVPKVDVQGMALVVEHIAAALGARRSHLDDKFKELWAANRPVMKLLKDSRFMKIGDERSINLD